MTFDQCGLSPVAVDLTGKRFGRLTVQRFLGHKAGMVGRHTYWECLCDCGQTTQTRTQSLLGAASQSCGCYQRDRARECATKHGFERLGLRDVWRHMVARCTEIDHPQWSDYGARGIGVCQQWIESFAAFATDMGARPSETHMIDRINNDGNYEPGNCRWATRTEQNRNKRSNHLLTFKGETKSLAEWCELLKLNYRTVRSRKRIGWSDEKALSNPTDKGRGRYQVKCAKPLRTLEEKRG